MPVTAFHPFALKEEDADESQTLEIDKQFFAGLYRRWAIFEDALSTICCTDAGADGVTAVTIQWSGKSSEDDRPLELGPESLRLGDPDPNEPIQTAIIAKNGGVSTTHQAYIDNVIKTIQRIDLVMNLVESKNATKIEQGTGNIPSWKCLYDRVPQELVQLHAGRCYIKLSQQD